MLAFKSNALALDAKESVQIKIESTNSKAIKSVEISNIMDRSLPREFTKHQLLKYIEHDTRTMRKLRQKIKGKLEVKEKNLEEINVLSMRIIHKYEKLFKTYKIDGKIFSDFIKFASKSNVSTSTFKTILNELMQSFHIDPEIYIKGAYYMDNDCNDLKQARRYTKQGIKFHSNYFRLYLEDFVLEVKRFNKSKFEKYEKAYDKYNNIVKRFGKSIDLQFTLMDIVLKYTRIERLHYVVISDLVNKYMREEKMWQRLATIQWKGFLFSLEIGTLDFCEDELTCIRHCFGIYDKALKKKIFSGNQQILWNFYLDSIIGICDKTDMNVKTIHDYMIPKIHDVFLRAIEDKALIKSEYFIFWADHSDEKTELMVLEKSVTVLRRDLDLWSRLIGFFLYRDLYKNALKVFQKCIHELKNKGSRIWRMMELYLMNTEDSMILRFYEQATTQIKYKKISLEFRPKYLNWCVLREGVCSARLIFQKLKDLEPPCKTLYLSMIKIENSTNASKRKKKSIIRRLFSEACKKFGHKDINIWIYYMKYEYKQGSDSCANTVYKTALKTLSSNLRNDFTAKKRKLAIVLRKKRKTKVVIEVSDDD